MAEYEREGGRPEGNSYAVVSIGWTFYWDGGDEMMRISLSLIGRRWFALPTLLRAPQSFLPSLALADPEPG